MFDQWRHRRTVSDIRERGLLDNVDVEVSELNPVEADFASDDLLRLLFTCCHPSLPESVQLVLTARAVAGLSRDELARALLISPRAAEQRYTRAKRQVSDLGLPYEVPSDAELPDRLAVVQRVVYLLFNEGYKASAGIQVARMDLVQQAVGLGRTLVRLFPSEPEVIGLLALMVLQSSRMAAREAENRVILLEEQDRDLWDRDLGIEGCALVEKALRLGKPGTYQIQAAIAAVHFEACDFLSTDWRQIEVLYEILETIDQSPVVTINREVAALYARGSAAAIPILESLQADKQLQGYPEFYAARAEILLHAGDREGALTALEQAHSLSDHEPTKEHLRKRVQVLRENTMEASS